MLLHLVAKHPICSWTAAYVDRARLSASVNRLSHSTAKKVARTAVKSAINGSQSSGKNALDVVNITVKMHVSNFGKPHFFGEYAVYARYTYP